MTVKYRGNELPYIQNDKMNLEAFEAGLSNPFAQQRVGHKLTTHRIMRFQEST